MEFKKDEVAEKNASSNVRTFWTICDRCKTYYQYIRVYLNHTLLCLNCDQAFVAIDNGPPPHLSRGDKRDNDGAPAIEKPVKKNRKEFSLSASETENMLIWKARTEIRKKLEEWRSLAADDTPKKKHDYTTILVPDSDFHNFELDRDANSFEADQVWAAYDEDDSMPRYYARIHKVISKKPFRIQISWLNSRTNAELGPIDWIDSGFYKTCGDFRVGKHDITESLNIFSHKVSWTKGNRGVIHIFPRKGQVWALYKNWSPDWNENTLEEVIHEYDMVEVLEDVDDEGVISVIPLVKVDGFKTVFQRYNIDQVRKIPKVEFFRFSHEVPSYVLTGQEAHNVPKGCRELDPAAFPLDLNTMT